MDYLDPRKEQAHSVILFTGYILITIGIVIGTLILIYRVYGFTINKQGAVIQDGLTYFSSHPSSATIAIKGQPNTSRTNTRLSLPEGIYSVTISRNGYHDWQRQITVIGGGVRHFDYPFLIPTNLQTKPIDNFTSAPGLVTQSPDRRWLLVEQPGSIVNFRVYDLKNPTKAADTISIPGGILSHATGSEVWQLSEWADDNRHVVLKHNYDGKTEYILVDRQTPGQSENLNTALSTTPTKLTLRDKKFDQYFIYDGASQLLQSTSLKDPSVHTNVQQHLLAYQSYGSNGLLYVTSDGAAKGQVLVKLDQGSHSYILRTFPSGTDYLVDLTQYSNSLYVAIGAVAQNKVYIYKDPIGQLAKNPHQALVPVQVLHVVSPNYLSFSSNAQFIVTESGTQFGVYDVQDSLGYSYTSSYALDAPQVHATWMDGDRLVYVSAGKLVMFDYDSANPETLMPADSQYLPFFAPDYKYVYSLGADASSSGGKQLQQTALLTPGDL